jgi:5'-nucleotidase
MVAKHPDIRPVLDHQRRSFHVRDDYPAEHRLKVDAIVESPDFYRCLPPVAGAIEAIQEILDEGISVFICTSPLTKYRNCVLEKYQWVEEHLGCEFTRRIILTTDKTLVCGDVLIDDKPAIVGAGTPYWRHLIFDQPYNRQADGARINWDNWRNVLLA